MAQVTPNLKLIEPELTDPADITQMNQNWDKLDEEIQALKNKAPEYTSNLNTFSAFDQIGVVAGQETITGIYKALPNDSSLQVEIDASNRQEIYPTPFRVGQLRVEKSVNRCVFKYFVRDVFEMHMYIGYYSNDWTGWKEVGVVGRVAETDTPLKFSVTPDGILQVTYDDGM